jgi:cell division septation protein DedD
LTYPDRLEEPDPVAEEVPAGVPAHEAFATTAVAKVPPPPSPPKAVVKPAPAAKSAVPAVATTTASKDVADAAPSGTGYVVQVAAVRQKSEAEAIRSRLTRKGYQAFVATAGTNGAPTYRVRVGKFSSKREADTVAAKLERDEQFKPWVTR